MELWRRRILTLEKCLQGLRMHFFVGAFVFVFSLPLSFLFIVFTSWWPLIVIYFIWVVYDEQMDFTNTLDSHWLKNLKIWEYIRDYYPCQLIKTADLKLDQNYMFLVHPHAYIPYSSIPNFITNANKVNSKLFPGIRIHAIPYYKFFYWPIVREIMRILGLRGSTESELMNILTRKPSNAVVLYVGGMKELHYADPGNVYVIVLRPRTGFLRIALKTGASLVPVFTFGEINAFRKCEFKKIRNPWWMFPETESAFGKNLCLWFGFGGFSLMVPKSVPVNTVVGTPLPVPKVENPTDDMIDVYRRKYIRALQELFEKYKHEYDTVGGMSQLIIV